MSTRTRLFVYAHIKTLGERLVFEGQIDALINSRAYALYLPHLYVPPGGCQHIVVQGDEAILHHLEWLDACEGLLVLGPPEHFDMTHPYVLRALELGLPLYRGLDALIPQPPLTENPRK